MAISLPVALYLLLSTFGALLCVWAAGSSLRAGPGLSTGHRLWGALTAIALPPVIAMQVLMIDRSGHLPLMLTVAIPVLALAATWTNVMTLSAQGALSRTLHVPVLAFNSLLVGVYAVRAVQELTGLDLGVIGTALTHAHGAVQTIVGHGDAAQNPIWLHMPLLLPVALRYESHHKMAVTASAAFGTAMVGLMAMHMPFAFQRVTGFRTARPEAASAPIDDIGVRVPWAERPFDDDGRDRIREALTELGVRHVAVHATPALLADRGLQEQLTAEVRWARSQGLAVLALAEPNPQRCQLPATDVGQLSRELAPLHAWLAENVAPDLLVLFTGPFHGLDRCLATGAAIDEWLAAIQSATEAVRRGSPEVRVAVSLRSRAPHAAELFRRLRAADSPVDSVALAIEPGDRDWFEVEEDLRVLTRWCSRIPGPRPVRALPVGCSPSSCGGELGQWNFLCRAMAAVTDNERLHAITLDALDDTKRGRGLLHPSGRHRLAFARLRDMLASTPTAAPR